MAFHFDRSGVQYTPKFNIHKDPKTFLRAILAVVSGDEKVLGLNTSIQWEIDENGRKTDGTVVVDTSKGGPTTYDLIKIDPEFHRYTLCGRGTTCWRAKLPDSPNSESVIIKYSWQSEGRTAEHVLLKKVRGIPGVGQMADYGLEERSTSKWRNGEGKPKRLPKNNFFNRVLTCTVLEGYGEPIKNFGSQMELFCAFRDCLAGMSFLSHRFGRPYLTILPGYLGLFEKTDHVHRDISPQNLLLGGPNALMGFRGMVVDFDMAVLKEREIDDVCSDPRSVRCFLRSAIPWHKTHIGNQRARTCSSPWRSYEV